MADSDQDRAARIRARYRDHTSEDCACTPDAPCLWHYDLLDHGRRAGARRRAGVHEPYVGRDR